MRSLERKSTYPGIWISLLESLLEFREGATVKVEEVQVCSTYFVRKPLVSNPAFRAF